MNVQLYTYFRGRAEQERAYEPNQLLGAARAEKPRPRGASK